MARKISRFGGWFGALVVIAALAFGASTAFASMPVCGDDIDEIGTCPPFDNTSCNIECLVQFPLGGGGACYQGATCCVCMI